MSRSWLTVVIVADLVGADARADVRPAGAGQGTEVAQVALTIGKGARLHAAGGDFAIAPGTSLLRTDEVYVPANEVLILRLRNDRVVRLDDDLTIAVDKIVLLDAPPTKESLSSQIDRLVTKAEQGRAERIAGAQARVSAATPVAPAPAVSLPATDDVARRSRGVVAPAPARSTSRTGSIGAVGGDTMPLTPEHLAAFRACVAKDLAALPIKLTHVPVQVHVTDGKIDRARLGGGLVTPRCLQKLTIGQTYATAPGWHERDVTLR